jgi:hypothetical protein
MQLHEFIDSQHVKQMYEAAKKTVRVSDPDAQLEVRQFSALDKQMMSKKFGLSWYKIDKMLKQFQEDYAEQVRVDKERKRQGRDKGASIEERSFHPMWNFKQKSKRSISPYCLREAQKRAAE